MLRTIILTTMLSLMGFGVAQADDFKPVPRGSYTLDLDTADGNFSEWNLNDLTDVNAVRAHVTFARKGKHKTYAAFFTLSLRGETKRGDVSFTALSANGPLYTVVGLKDEKGKISEDMVLVPPELGEDFDLKIRWSGDGKISLDIYSKANRNIGQGFEHREIDLGEPVTGLTIGNSTGEIVIDPLQLGQDTN